MTKNYDVAGMTLEQYLKKAGDVHIGTLTDNHILQVEDFEDAELFTYEEGFCCGSFELNAVIEQIEYYEKYQEGYENKYGEYYPSYKEEYGRTEPADSFFELYAIANDYVVAYEEVKGEYEVNIVWLKRKGEKR